ncbi:uncharacterized protein DUF262 [Thiobaca trueperi]|uniref:Uncharacterized protein DUF262 n=2 Tax=Thiobaca trueperi TaxID=127458 RepID=A0A4R3MZE6_9GAMM|nr:uncharacterized protein DUF262 [Thiobaca trueperi]
MVKESKLLPRPEFQRRLVWSRDDKNHFLDSVLRGYPFPEIYFADGDVNLETGEGTQLLVDGLQRVSTLIQYFDGDDNLKLTSAPTYRALNEDEKKAFLQYDVAVRDLGGISKEEIIEVFKRLNATKYSLLDIEINNAVYAGALKTFCEQIAEKDFFRAHNIFNASDYKRMGDLRYVLSLVGTMVQGYFNRDDAFENLLDRYNDEFPMHAEISGRLQNIFDFIEECGFDPKTRAWKKADLFTLLIELDQVLHIRNERLQPSKVLEELTSFYDGVDSSGVNQGSVSSIYYKAALQASNDKINRVRRGAIIGGILLELSESEIREKLRVEGLA